MANAAPFPSFEIQNAEVFVPSEMVIAAADTTTLPAAMEFITDALGWSMICKVRGEGETSER